MDNLASRMTPYVADNYMPIPESGCWLWLGAWSSCGYGRLCSVGRNCISTHRLFYAHHKGPIPPGALVLHKCDTRPCCNPDHLFLGNTQDNAIDRERKNRGRWRAKRDASPPYSAEAA